MSEVLLKLRLRVLCRILLWYDRAVDFYCLQPYWAVNDFKSDYLASHEGFVTVHFYSREVSVQM
ncbi:hypothetical protein RA277_30755, partial [Pseudomonas syringae pv. tagetis]